MWDIYIYIFIYLYIYIYINIYKMEYYSAIKKEWNNVICSNMDGPKGYHAKWSKSDKDKYHMIPLICVI